MDSTLKGHALDWSANDPCLVRYLGRIEGEGYAKALVAKGLTRVVLPHEAVFWLGAMCSGDMAMHRLVQQVGHA